MTAVLATIASLAQFIAALATTSPTPAVPAPTDRLAMFLGSWTSDGSIQDDASGKLEHVVGKTTCSWSSSERIFLVCDGSATVGEAKTADHQLSVYTYDASSKQYGFVAVTSAHVASPELTVNENTWTYSGKFTVKPGHTTYFRTLNIFDTPDRYRFRIESGSDGVHWTQTGSGISRRAGTAEPTPQATP